MINVGGYLEYRGGVQYRGGIMSTVGDIMNTVGGYLEYRGGCSVPWGYHDARGGYHEYRGGCSVLLQRSLRAWEMTRVADACGKNLSSDSAHERQP